MVDKVPKVIYRGVSVIAGWPERIHEAQETTTCVVNGEIVSRVRYGDENDDWGADSHPCHDCAVIKGEFHVEGCDGEQCPGCGEQRGGCDCEPDEDDD